MSRGAPTVPAANPTESRATRAPPAPGPDTPAPALARPAPARHRRPPIWRRPVGVAAVVTATRLLAAVAIEKAVLAVVPLRGFPLRPASAPGQSGWVGFFAWDAQFYKLIFEHGYPRANPERTSFFPLYPLLVRTVAGATTLRYDVAALVVSWAGLFVAVWAVVVLVDRVVPGAGGWKAGVLLAWFPASAFLVAGYAEPVFVACVAGTFAALACRRPGLAVVAAACGAAARPEGVVLGLAVLAWLVTERRGWRRTVLATLGSEVGFLAWSGFLWARFGSPVEEITVQRLWHRSLSWPLHPLVWSLEQMVGDKLRGAGTSNMVAVWLLDDVCIAAAVASFVALVWLAREKVPALRWMLPATALVVLLAVSNGPSGIDPESADRVVMCIVPLAIPFARIRSLPVVVSVLAASAAAAALFQGMFNLGGWFT